MLRFISFGSGSSGNCYYLYTETDSLLIDVGVGLRILKKHFHNYGLRFEDIHHILITHDHADHVKSVGSLSNDYHLSVYTCIFICSTKVPVLMGWAALPMVSICRKLSTCKWMEAETSSS